MMEKPRSCSISMETDRCLSSTQKTTDSGAESCSRSVMDKNNWNWRSQTVCCYSLVVVLLTVLSCVAVAFCVHLYGEVKAQGEMVQNLRNDYETLRREAEEDRVVASSAMEGEGGTTYQDGIWQIPGLRDGLPDKIRRRLTTRLKRNAHGRGNSIPNGGSNALAQARRWIETLIEQYHQEMPKVHLQGLEHGETSYTDENSGFLLWREDPRRFHRVGVSFDHDRPSGRIKYIRINRPGIYLVYAQVVINGTVRSEHRRDCNHETVVMQHSDGSGDATVLMSGYLTQDEEGRRYNLSAVPYPRDSSLQMGLFRLHRQDHVGVRIPYHSLECHSVNFATHMHASYFGLYKIE